MNVTNNGAGTINIFMLIIIYRHIKLIQDFFRHKKILTWGELPPTSFYPEKMFLCDRSCNDIICKLL